VLIDASAVAGLAGALAGGLESVALELEQAMGVVEGGARLSALVTVIADPLPDDVPVLLLDMGLVVLVVRPATIAGNIFNRFVRIPGGRYSWAGGCRDVKDDL
jgi:hypothetical protein